MSGIITLTTDFGTTSERGNSLTVQADGKILVLYWWASWCPFCALQSPHMETLWRTQRARGRVVRKGERTASRISFTFSGRSTATNSLTPGARQGLLPRTPPSCLRVQEGAQALGDAFGVVGAVDADPPVLDGDDCVGSVTEGLMARVLEDAKSALQEAIARGP